MDLFLKSKEHPEWGWLSEIGAPWRILSDQSERSLKKMIIELISKEVRECKDLTKVDLSGGPIFVHPDVKLSTSIKMEGPIYIESGAEIRHGAYLRPGSYISSGCVVGHCSEIKNTIMFRGSKIPHFNYVGDSILGYGVNLGAGAKISNVRLDGNTIQLQYPDGSRVDSGLKKMGALIGDFSQLGCNVVTNPGAILSRSSAVPPNTTVSGYWDLG